MTLAVHAAASAELTAATDWYDAERTGLGDDLLGEASRAIAAIAEAPRMWPLVQGSRTVRRFKLSRFPYVVYYRFSDEHVLVVAFGHASRRPGYWADRVED